MEWKVATIGIFLLRAMRIAAMPEVNGQCAWTILNSILETRDRNEGSISAIPVTYGCRKGTGTEK